MLPSLDTYKILSFTRRHRQRNKAISLATLYTIGFS